MLSRLLSFVCALAVMLSASRVAAQQLVVQQPVLGVTSGAMTVSVPDRGSAAIGGISRAGHQRTWSGPWGSHGTGVFRSHSSLGVSARIIDLEAADRALLRQPRPAPDPQLAPMAEHAWQILSSRQAHRGLGNTGPSPRIR